MIESAEQMTNQPPHLIVVGGPNGAGKSTFVRKALESEGRLYLCADEAAFELCPDDPESVAAAAGRLFLERIRDALEKRIDVIVESTLSGKSFRRTVQSYAKAGYQIDMIFVTPLDCSDSVARVARRVQKGGHHVPEHDIRRRFVRSHSNFWEIYRHLVNGGWSVFHNESDVGANGIAEGSPEGVTVLDDVSFERFLHFCYAIETR